MKASTLNLVLLTTGLRPVARDFADFPENPVGIVSWDLPPATAQAGWKRTLRRLLARARGRRYADLAHLCEQHDLRFAAIDKREPEALKRCLAEWNCHLVITSGCAMVPMRALSGLSVGAINLHPSLLPAYRGANPLFWQALDGVENTGVTVHRLSAGADRGDILGQREVARLNGASLQQLTQLTEAQLGVPLLRDVVSALATGDAEGLPQPEYSPTAYAKAVKPEMYGNELSLAQLSSEQVWNVVQFHQDVPAAWTKATRSSSTPRVSRWYRWRPLAQIGALRPDVTDTWQWRHWGPLRQLRHASGSIWFLAWPARRH